jgi:riboflavin kinase/FMN adenylyltransferase
VALARTSVVTIGNFDGVHLGHRALIGHCQSLSRADDALALVTFEPLPRGFFDPGNPPPRLTSPAERVRLVDQAGVDLVWLMRFDDQLASMGPEDFVRRVLVESLGARHVVTGNDFRFGHRREGDLALMSALGRQYGFESHVVATVTQGGRRVSSGAVREALAEGELETAAELLGRPYSISGRVLRGRQLGRKLGYPTANLKIRALPCPLQGIFAVRARVVGEIWRPAVASLGWRPMVGGEEMLLEVHFFDFEADLYGQRLETQFVAKLRDEAHFATIDDMVRQMKDDERQAREILSTEQWITKTP